MTLHSMLRVMSIGMGLLLVSGPAAAEPISARDTLSQLPFADQERLAATRLTIALPTDIPPGFKLVKMTFEDIGMFGQDIILIYRGPGNKAFAVESIGGGIGGPDFNPMRPYATSMPLFGDKTVVWYGKWGGKGPDTWVNDWVGDGPYYRIMGAAFVAQDDPGLKGAQEVDLAWARRLVASMDRVELAKAISPATSYFLDEAFQRGTPRETVKQKLMEMGLRQMRDDVPPLAWGDPGETALYFRQGDNAAIFVFDRQGGFSYIEEGLAQVTVSGFYRQANQVWFNEARANALEMLGTLPEDCKRTKNGYVKTDSRFAPGPNLFQYKGWSYPLVADEESDFGEAEEVYLSQDHQTLAVGFLSMGGNSIWRYWRIFKCVEENGQVVFRQIRDLNETDYDSNEEEAP